MSETIQFEDSNGKGVGSVNRKLLQGQSRYFCAFLGEGGALWGDRSEVVKFDEVDLEVTKGYLAFLRDGWADVGGFGELLDLLVFADKIGADHLVRHLSGFFREDTIVHAMQYPFMHEWCKEFLLTHFERVFSDLNTMQHITPDAIPLVLNVVQSDDLAADEDKVLEVALKLYKKFGLDQTKPILQQVRLSDVGLVGLDEVKGEGEVGVLLMEGLCEAYARHAHLARRTKFVPFDGRKKLLFTRTLREWPTTPFSFFCGRLSEVSFTATIARGSLTLTPSHTFSEHIPLRATLTITGTTTSTHTFALSFCDCNVPHGWPDLPIPPSFLNSGGRWTLTAHIQFTTELLPHDCG